MRVVTVAIIVREDKVLLIRRKNEPFKDHWCLISGVGGHIWHRNLIDAVEDEVHYDIGCNFLTPKFFKCQREFFYNVHDIVVYFAGTIKDEPKMTRNVAGFGWFTFEEAMCMDLGFDNHKVLSEYLASKIIGE